MPRKALVTSPVDDDAMTPETRAIPLDQLYLHPLNPRQEPPEADIEALAASIKAVGLLQNLSGFADTGHTTPEHIGIVAGGRRLRALQLLAARGDWQGPVPVHITTDADLAGQWAGAENETHIGLTDIDQIAAYHQMRKKGHSTAAIADAFAKPVGYVRQRLALATLPDTALDALRAGKITIEHARALTSARTAEDQDAALQSALAGKPEYHIRNMLRRDTVSTRDKRARYIGLQAYHDAGGSSTTDLFAEDVILHDAALLDQLATEKATAETEATRATEGWLWTEYVPENFWQISEKHRRIHAPCIPLPEGDAERLEQLGNLDFEEMTDEEQDEFNALEARSVQQAFTDDALWDELDRQVALQDSHVRVMEHPIVKKRRMIADLRREIVSAAQCAMIDALEELAGGPRLEDEE
jgi:ParB family chromosome partitioning protein